MSRRAAGKSAAARKPKNKPAGREAYPPLAIGSGDGFSSGTGDRKSMNFSVKQFVQTNKQVFIWTIFFLLLYLLRGLFGLVFLTFILCFIFQNVTTWLNARTGLPRKLWTVVVYLIFVALVSTIIALIGPKLGAESKLFFQQMPQTQIKVHQFLDRIAEQQPNLEPMIDRLKEGLSVESMEDIKRDTVVSFIVGSFNRITHYFSFFLLGTLFSFLILLDFSNLRSRAMALRQTRLHEVYEETADSVVKFAQVVGEAFQAQILIACVNTFLTAIGLYILKIHPIALLATIVFFTGLIPVLGVFISSLPILLVAFNTGGGKMAGAVLALIIIIHSIEAYFLNPRILSAMFKINPVLTLIILYIGGQLFGLWGVLLGVPVTVYIYRYAIMERAAVSDKVREERSTNPSTE